MTAKTKVKMPKAPVQPSFYMQKPIPPMGKEKEEYVWSGPNDEWDGRSLEDLLDKVKRHAENNNISNYRSTIRQTYCSSESGYVEFDLRIVYNNNNPTESEVKAYEKQLEKYNQAKAIHDQKMQEYKVAKAKYDADVKAFNDAKELELLNKLIKKHGVPHIVSE